MAEQRILKDSIENILSIDVEMFPSLRDTVYKIATIVVEKFAEKSLVEIESEKGDNGYLRAMMIKLTEETLGKRVHLLSFSDQDMVRTKIEEYKKNSFSKSGGGALLKELDLIYNFKEGLFDHIGKVKEILIPKEVTRTTLAGAKKDEQEKNIQAVASGFRMLEEKILRQLAETVIGDVQLEYTKDELPYVVAKAQITGKVE